MKNLFLGSAVLLLTLPSIALASVPALTSKKVCKVGDPKCVEIVIKTMERRYKPLAKQCDHDAVFALTYLRTTETFLQTLDDIGYEDKATLIL